MTDLFLSLLRHSISAGWIVLAAVALRLLLRRAPKWILVAVWGLVAIRLVMPVTLESELSLMPSQPAVLQNAAGSYGGGYVMGSFGDVTASADPWQIWLPILTAVWAVGVAAMLTVMAVSWLRLHRRLRHAMVVEEGVYVTEHSASPFVFGLLRPRIYLPFGISKKMMPHVIAHEKAHIRRRDHWWKPLGFLLLAIHWFHPLLWLAYILLCRDIELACDEKVIRKLDGQGRADYSQALLTVSISRRSITVCPLAFGEVGVKERVKTVLSYKKPVFWIILVALLACVAVAVCLLTDPVAEPEPIQPSTQESTQPTEKTPAAQDPTQPQKDFSWLNDQKTDEEVVYYPPALRFAVDTQLQGYILENLPDGVLRTYGYRIYSQGEHGVTAPENPAKVCIVKLLVMFKDYTITGSGIGDIREGEEVLAPAMITFGMADGNYYAVDLQICNRSSEAYHFMPELAGELLSPDKKTTDELRQICEDKLQDHLRDQSQVLPDTAGNSMDTLLYDMDGDGIQEEFYLGSVAGEDVFTFLVGIKQGYQPLYQGVFGGSPGKLSFETDSEGVLVCCQPEEGAAVYYRVTVADNAVVLAKK